LRARYGYACSSALDQLAVLEQTASELSAANVRVGDVLEFMKHAPRDAG